jgi:hypothetical protein
VMMIRLQPAHVPEQRGHGEQHDQPTHQRGAGDDGAIPLRLLAAAALVKVTVRGSRASPSRFGEATRPGTPWPPKHRDCDGRTCVRCS